MNKPNIILIVIDSLRADHVGCYGYERETTPNLDNMAANGVKFDKCYANSYWSLPSHASLFTGDLPSAHRVLTKKDPYFDQENKLASQLKSKGYYTYGNSNNMWINNLYGFDKEFDKFDFQLWSSDFGDEKSNQILEDLQSRDWKSRREKYKFALKKSLKNSPKTLFHLLEFKFERKFGKKWGLFDFGGKKTLRRIQKEAKGNEPIFGFTNLMEVHTSYVPPLGFKRKYSSYSLPKAGVIDHSKKVSDQNLQERINLYDDCIRYEDKLIGEFVESFLEQNPNTVFIITSDHGELFFDNSMSFEEQKQGHISSPSDELIKVPLIVYGNFDESKIDSDGIISLRDIPALTDSLAENRKFESKNWAICENFPLEGPIYQRIRTPEGVLTQTENQIYFDGEEKNGLLTKLKEETKEISEIKSKLENEEILDSIDF